VLIRVEGTLIIRVFAMYGRNWWILICLLVVFSPAPVLALVCFPQVFTSSVDLRGVVGCYQGETTTDVLRAGDRRVCYGDSANIVSTMIFWFYLKSYAAQDLS
jgi:hypothetical protein